MKPLFTKRGLVTREGFACGHVQHMPEGVVIGKCLHGRGLLVRADSGYSRVYLGPSLREARRAASEAVRLIRAFNKSGWRTRDVWNGTGTEVRVEMIGPDGQVSGPYASDHDARLAWAARNPGDAQ